MCGGSVHSPAIVHDARWGCMMRMVGGRVVRCSRVVKGRRRGIENLAALAL